MAKKVIVVETASILGGPPKSGTEATLIQGVFVGVDTNGDVLPADYRASQSAIRARGFVREDVVHKDVFGNAILTDDRVSYGRRGRIGGFSGLTKGATYYLHSGGGITATKPAATTNDIDQKVGWAFSDTELEVEIADEVVHA
jgi:hypothetical protein